MATLIEKIVQDCRDLPEETVQEVFDFVEFLKTRKSATHDMPFIPQVRQPGSLKGQIWIADDFDAPLDENECADWYESPIFPKNQVDE